jgi:hypothetical protein
MSLEANALQLRIACDLDRAANDFGWQKITVGTTHGALALGQEMRGKFLYLCNKHASAFAEVGLSLTATAEIDINAAPGSTTKVGTPVPPSTIMRIGPLPDWDSSKTMYLIHEADASLTMLVGKGSGSV